MAQLGLTASPEQAVPLLHRAATLASLDVPQPAYVFGLLLLAEFAHVTIPPQLFTPYIPKGSSPIQEARRHLERAAYLNFAPAQYKLGHAYEFAQPPFPFDPLLSVQYYSLASQQGEIEADMALSKWFLCGAEGAFEKDESLAFTFAEKAARKGLPSAEFALGYYAEVGVGCPKDVDAARKWYLKASEHGNVDAVERLKALSQAQPRAFSRQEHDTITESKLIRKRTQARQRSDVIPNGAIPPAPAEGRRIVEVIRKNSLPMYTIPADSPLQHTQRLQTMPVNSSQPQSTSFNQGQRGPSQTMPDNSSPPQSTPFNRGQRRPSQTMPDNSSPPHSTAFNQGHGRKPSAPNITTPSSSPRLRPAQPGGRPPTQNRYTLTDVPQQQQRRQSGRPLTASPTPSSADPGAQESAPATQQQPSKGPTTFAEMGFHSGKADEKECVIM
jgi:TPR repeat protein